MQNSESLVAVFPDHTSTESGVKKLSEAGFEMSDLSVISKGYHSEEKVVGIYSSGDRISFWGTRGAFWGGLWGQFFGTFLFVPVVGSVVVLGYLATVAISVVEEAVVVGGLSALGAALYSIGVPKDGVIRYEAALKADGFLVMAHGSAAEIARAKTILGTTNATGVDVHVAVAPTVAKSGPVPAVA